MSSNKDLKITEVQYIDKRRTKDYKPVIEKVLDMFHVFADTYLVEPEYTISPINYDEARVEITVLEALPNKTYVIKLNDTADKLKPIINLIRVRISIDRYLNNKDYNCPVIIKKLVDKDYNLSFIMMVFALGLGNRYKKLYKIYNNNCNTSSEDYQKFDILIGLIIDWDMDLKDALEYIDSDSFNQSDIGFCGNVIEAVLRI